MRKKPGVKTFVGQKKKMGRPVTVEGKHKLDVRLSDRQLDALDAWASEHDVSRSEAVRRLIDGLAGTGGTTRKGKSK